MAKLNIKTRKNKIIVIVVIFVLATLAGLLVAYKQYEQRKNTDLYPQDYPYSCTDVSPNQSSESISKIPPCAMIEDKGKVIVANRPEVKQLVQKYGRKGVVVQALEFADIQDKDFLKHILGEHYTELGCIIYVTYPGGQNVYLEDEKLGVISQLDGQVFAKWLQTASDQDIARFNKNLH